MRRLYPILCNYYVTTRCNARCVFCDIHRRPGVDANPTDVEANLRALTRLGISFVDFTGGEPLLHPQLPIFLEQAKRLKLRTTVTTNTLLYPQRARELAGKVDLLHFSLDASTAEDHDALRGVPCFDRVMQSLDLAQSLGEKPDLLFTLTDDNAHHLDALVTLAQTRRLMLIINPVFAYFDNPGAGKVLLDTAKEAAGRPYVYVNLGMLRLMKKGGNQTGRPRCRAVTTTVVIDPENQLLLPCYHQALNRLPIQGQLEARWQSSVVNHARKMEGRHPFCQNCAISCYFDPSFTHTPDTFFWLSLGSKVKYAWDKYLRL